MGSAAIHGSPPSQVYTYFLSRDDVSPSAPPPTFSDTWYGEGWTGWYVYLAAPVVDGEAFVTAARQALPPLTNTGQAILRGLVWLRAPNAFVDSSSLVFYQLMASPDIRSVTESFQLNWTPLSLTFSPGLRIGFDFENNAFLITTDPMDTGTVAFNYGGQPSFYDSSIYTWYFTLPLTGPGAGALGFQLGLDLGLLSQTLGCSLNFFYSADDQVQTLEFPFYPPVAPGNTLPGFSIWLHPLFETDPSWTRFQLDFGGASPNRYQQASRDMRGAYFRTTEGGTLTLAPSQSAGSPGNGASAPGFAFCRAPNAASPEPAAPSQLYLAPVGTYEVVQISDASGSPEVPDEVAHWMCGLSGQEYVEVAIGDCLELISPFPAWERGKGKQNGGEPGLDNTFTAPWVRFPAVPPDGTRRYFGQPNASVYYSVAAPGEFASPVQSMLAELSAPSVFPAVPYGGIYVSPNFNGSVPAQAFGDFESRALALERHRQMTATAGPPVFIQQPKAHLLEFAFGAPPPPVPSAVTPQGFVARLNGEGAAAGTWSSIEMARSPDNPEQYLSFAGNDSPSLVPTPLASTLLQNQLFFVVSDSKHLGQFKNELSLAGFNFTLDVGQSSNGPVDGQTTLLIFKYNTSMSLKEFADQPELWASKDSFIRDLAGTQTQIREAIAEAEADTHSQGDSPLANFKAIANSKLWTGVLALHCAIDGNGMPPDFQMLLGGINGRLRAHHLGIQSNRLAPVGDDTAIELSSLFGVIAYPSLEQPLPPVDTKDDFDFEVETLHVVFANSKIASFNCVVGLTVNKIMGREVELLTGSGTVASPHNTLEIPGRYQLQDGVGTVSFSSSQPFVYRFPVPDKASRVLDQVLFDQATLVPISTNSGSPGHVSPHDSPHSDDAQVQSRFSLGGSIYFQPEPFPEAPGLDLFSYGNPGSPAGGLAFTEFAVNIGFTLDSQGAVIPQSKRVTGDLTRLSVQGGASAIRPQSLLYSLPLQISKFLASDAGFSSTSLGANPVHVLQLAGKQGQPVFSPVASPMIRTPAPPPNVTTMPNYGLEFDMPLGTLGALSSVHVGLMAKLIIAWGPSRIAPDTDAATVLVQLPQVFAGYGSFNLQGILKTTFGDANLLKVDLENDRIVYALLFNNIQLSVLGYGFPPGVVVDFLIFAGSPEQGSTATNDKNLAWFLGAYQPSTSPASEQR